MTPLNSILATALAVGIPLWPAVDATPVGHEKPATLMPAARQPQPACSEGAILEKLWLVNQLNVTYTQDELVRPGNATWTITNTLTNTTERLHCPLRANYICEMNGTPADDSLHIWLQINLDVATFTINQSVPCGSEPPSSPAYAIGTAELYLICHEKVADEDMSCNGDDDGGGYANGLVTTGTPPIADIAPRDLSSTSSKHIAGVTNRKGSDFAGAPDTEAAQGHLTSGCSILSRQGRRTLPVMPTLWEER